MTITGTHHFVSLATAMRYYREYGYMDVRASVKRKIREGEIALGKPELKPGDVLRIIDNGCRYAIERSDEHCPVCYGSCRVNNGPCPKCV